MSAAPVAVIVLAAGEGTRMRSALPKVLHGFAGRSLLGHVLAATAPLDAPTTLVVVGHGRDQVTAHLTEIAPTETGAAARPVVQAERHGTGHAVRLALEAAPDIAGGTVVVVPGDAPLLSADVLAALVTTHDQAHAAATLLTSVVADPTGYGRVIRDEDGGVREVVEERDAAPDQRRVDEVATSVYAFDADLLREAVGQLSRDNAQGEEYLTDVIGAFAASGRRLAALVAPAELTAGVNDRVQLGAAHRAYNSRLIVAHQRAGVTVIDPQTTWLDAAVTLEPDVTLRPSVELRGATHVAAGAEVGPDTTLTDTTVGAGAMVTRTVAVSARIGAEVTVGPFAYLRPGAELADRAHIGTFVEIKNSEVGPGSKVPHLTYVGDATIGAASNVGASSVFVNYDGVAKHRSVVGDHVKIASDTMIVAPVTVGDGAYTAAGSVITQDVPPGALAVARGRQRNVEDWVVRRRAGTPAAEAAARARQDSETEGDA